MAKGSKKSSKKDQTIELSLPDELFDKVAAMSKEDEETLTHILQSILGRESKFGIKNVVISRRRERAGKREILRYEKLC